LCERDLKEAEEVSDRKLSRLMSEASQQPKFSNLALAKWTDKTNRTLMCRAAAPARSVEKF